MCCGWWKQERTEQEIPWPRFWLMSKINKYQSCLCFKCSPPRPSSPLQVFLRNCMISRTNPLLCASTVFCHSLATAHPYHSFRITFSSWLSTLSTVSLYPRPWRPPSKVSSQCCLLLNESFPCPSPSFPVFITISLPLHPVLDGTDWPLGIWTPFSCLGKWLFYSTGWESVSSTYGNCGEELYTPKHEELSTSVFLWQDLTCASCSLFNHAV